MVGDGVLGHAAFDWYYDGPLQSLNLGDERRDDDAIVAALRTCTTDEGRSWLILRQAAVSGDRLDKIACRSGGFHLLEQPPFKGVLIYLLEPCGDSDLLESVCRPHAHFASGRGDSPIALPGVVHLGPQSSGCSGLETEARADRLPKLVANRALLLRNLP